MRLTARQRAWIAEWAGSFHVLSQWSHMASACLHVEQRLPVKALTGFVGMRGRHPYASRADEAHVDRTCAPMLLVSP